METVLKDLLIELLDEFCPCDPSSAFYGEEVNGGDAVDFLSEFVPRVRAAIDQIEG